MRFARSHAVAARDAAASTLAIEKHKKAHENENEEKLDDEAHSRPPERRVGPRRDRACCAFHLGTGGMSPRPRCRALAAGGDPAPPGTQSGCGPGVVPLRQIIEGIWRTQFCFIPAGGFR